MYLHLGQQTVITTKEILGIFDLDTATVSAKTRFFLKKAQQNGDVINVSQELPKSFILCESGKVYISQLSPATLLLRLEKGNL